MMSQQELARAIHDLMESECSSAAFYTTLAGTATDPAVASFFEEMAQAEAGHAEALDNLAQKLPEDLANLEPSGTLGRAEIAMGWGSAEGLSLQEAMEVALEAEQNALLVFDALAETNGGMAGQLFARLARAEEAHVEQLRQRMERP
jgi:rubrerythrin